MIAEALAAYADATLRVFEGREHTIGASEIGQCARKLFWTKNQGDPVRGAPRNPDYVDRAINDSSSTSVDLLLPDQTRCFQPSGFIADC